MFSVRAPKSHTRTHSGMPQNCLEGRLKSPAWHQQRQSQVATSLLVQRKLPKPHRHRTRKIKTDGGRDENQENLDTFQSCQQQPHVPGTKQGKAPSDSCESRDGPRGPCTNYTAECKNKTLTQAKERLRWYLRGRDFMTRTRPTQEAEHQDLGAGQVGGGAGGMYRT